jgi:hypothetical protein
MDRSFAEKFFHDVGPLFTPLSAHQAAHRAVGQTVAGGVKPADKGGVTAESVGSADEFDEDSLGDVLGQSHVLIHLSQGRRIDQIHLTPDQFREGILFTPPRVLAEQSNVTRNDRGSRHRRW